MEVLYYLLNVNCVLITAVAVLSTSLAVSLLGGKKSKLPPGPTAWPLLGSLPYIVRSCRRRLKNRANPLDLMVQLAKDFGDVVHLRVLGMDVIVLSDPAAIREAYHRIDFSGRPEAVYSTVAGRPNFGLVMASGNVAKEQRQIAHSFFRTFGIGKSSFEEKIITEAGHLIEDFEKTEGKPFDPKQAMNNAVSNIICSVVFGSRHDYDDPVFNALQDAVYSNLQISRSGGCFFFLHWLANIPYSPGYYIRKNVACIIAQVKAIVDEHVKDHSPNHPRDMIDMYIDKIRDVKKDLNSNNDEQSASKTTYDETNMLFTLADTFSGGSETSTTALRWLLLHMAAEPDIQRRVHEEIDRVVGRDRLPTLADRPKMHYTEATIFEVMRRDFLVPVGAPHRYIGKGGGNFRGYYIPEGALVIANNWKISHDPELWTDPDVYRPERFMNAEGTFVKPDDIMPFSVGKRVCIGESLAKMELFLVFTHLLQRFAFAPPDASTSYSLDGEFGAVYTPRPYQLRAVARS